MNKKYFSDHKDITIRQLFPGIQASILHTDQLTASLVSLDAGADLPEHSHPHEQLTHIIEGELEMTVGNETTILKPGMTATIPSNVAHSGRAVSDCKVIDIFNPPRTDLQ
jgi:quercetin dioxygenase-like cupin family protein